MAPRKTPEAIRFARLTDKSGGPDACWPWLGARDRRGYGLFAVDAKQVRAHRHAFEKAVRLLAPGEQALHRCDNPSCVNDRHLFAGSAAEGEANGMAKLKAEDVRTIRALRAGGALLREVAARYHIAESAVSRIVNRVRWRNVA